jgi:hypothetical protein
VFPFVYVQCTKGRLTLSIRLLLLIKKKMHHTTAQLMDKAKKNSHVSNRALMVVRPHQPQNKLKGDSIKEERNVLGGRDTGELYFYVCHSLTVYISFF